MAIAKLRQLQTSIPYFSKFLALLAVETSISFSRPLLEMTQADSFIHKHQSTLIKLPIQEQLHLITCLFFTIKASQSTHSMNHSAFSHDSTSASLLLGIAYR